MRKVQFQKTGPSTTTVESGYLANAPVTLEKRESRNPKIMEVNVKDGCGTLRIQSIYTLCSMRG